MAAFDAAMMVKSRPVRPRRTSLQVGSNVLVEGLLRQRSSSLVTYIVILDQIRYQLKSVGYQGAAGSIATAGLRLLRCKYRLRRS